MIFLPAFYMDITGGPNGNRAFMMMDDLTDMLGGPDDKEKHERIFLFWDKFMPVIASHKAWKDGSSSPENSVSEHCTPEDEAFGVVVLENYSRYWLQSKVQGLDANEWEIFDDLPYTSTTGGARNGWNNAGIRKYNEIRAQIMEERKRQPRKELEAAYCAKYKSAWKNEAGKVTGSCAKGPVMSEYDLEM